MTAKFTVYGEPRGKARPRVTAHGTYTPPKTKQYEQLIRAEFERQTDVKFSDAEPLSMQVTAYYGIPKSASKKKRADMICGTILPTKKPDCDNVVKIIADALNGIAYKDDAQIVAAHVVKFYDDEPRVEVQIAPFREKPPTLW